MQSLRNPSTAALHFRRSPPNQSPVTVKASPCRFNVSRPLLSTPGIEFPLVAAHRRWSSFAPAAASHEESHSEVNAEKENNENKVKDEISEEAWKESLENFKVEALKVKAMSEEAYGIYSKKAMEILMDTSEKLKIQADKSKEDLTVIANEIAEEGKEYILAAAKNSPDSVRDVVEVYASVDEVRNIADVRDFYLGIPYGLFLSVGGFLTFMLTGSITAIRFGVILGGAILALSVSSLRLWKTGKATPLLLKGQMVIAAIIFLRQWLLWCKRGSFSRLCMLTISFAMVAFYTYRIIVDGWNKSQNIEETSEN